MVMKANGTLVVLLLAATSVRAEPVLKFPFFEGERWWVAQGSQVSRTIPNCTHYDSSSLQHSWDFNNFTGDKYRPVLAAAGGTVVTVQAVPSAEGAWGNIIVIDYGGGVYGKVAHLTKMLVRPGQRVRQGEVVGLCGGTPMWFPHIHYENQTGTKANSISVPSTFIDPDWSRSAAVANICTDHCGDSSQLFESTNGGAFEDAYMEIGASASAKVGTLVGDTALFPYTCGGKLSQRPWWKPWKKIDTAPDDSLLYDTTRDNIAVNFAHRRYQGGAWKSSAIVYDALGGARHAYIVRSGFFYDPTGWEACVGKDVNCDLGFPLGGEYAIAFDSNGLQVKARQDFQRGYLLWDKGATPPTSKRLRVGSDYTPGMFDRGAGVLVDGESLKGWGNNISYGFADAYLRSGAYLFLGEPIKGVTNHPDIATVLFQEFPNSSLGRGVLFYDLAGTLPKGYEDKYRAHEAHLVRGSFLPYFEAQGGVKKFGAPVSDEFLDPNRYQCRQDFALGACLIWNSSMPRDTLCRNDAPSGTVKVGKIGDMDCQIVDTSSSDSDHDGIPDTEDRCTGTPPQVVVDQEGCSISDRVPPCAEYKNKGDFQSTLAHVVNEFRKACLISGEEGGKIKSRGAHFHPGEGTCTEADIDVHTTPDRQLPPGCGVCRLCPSPTSAVRLDTLLPTAGACRLHSRC
jgi:hypothetical protein